MKKNLIYLSILGVLAVYCMSSCKSSERCAAYQDSRANTQNTISQFHSRG